MNTRPASSFELRGWHVLAALIAFFGITIAVNVGFMVAAIGTFPGEDVKRSYLQGLHYNQTLADRRAQAALGWHAGASLESRGGQTVLEVRLRDSQGRPLDGLEISGALRRPADAREDHALSFTPLGDGVYRARLEKIAPGQWEVRARAERGADAFDVTRRLEWRP